MITKLIGLNEYRSNLTKLWKESQKKKIRYIVMVHSRPVFEVNPILNNNFDCKGKVKVSNTRKIRKSKKLPKQENIV